MKIVMITEEVEGILEAMEATLRREGYRLYPGILRSLLDRAQDSQMTTAEFDALIRDAERGETDSER